MDWYGHEEYGTSPTLTWNLNGEPGGEVTNHDNVTFLRIFCAHLVSWHKPEVALAMLNRWTSGHYAIV